MRTVNTDTLISTGQPPWRPTPDAQDVDIWDKYDFPLHGTYRLGNDLVIFTVITTAGNRSLWAYVPVSPESSETVATARFDTEDAFNDFLEACFTGHEAVFAAAENFIITAKSDGVQIPLAPNALLAAGTKWYFDRAMERATLRRRQTAEHTDAENLLRAAQGVMENLSA
jgi:transposase